MQLVVIDTVILDEKYARNMLKEKIEGGVLDGQVFYTYVLCFVFCVLWALLRKIRSFVRMCRALLGMCRRWAGHAHLCLIFVGSFEDI